MKAEYNLTLVRQFLSDFNEITHLHVAMFDTEKRGLYAPPRNAAELCTQIDICKAGRLGCMQSVFRGLSEAEEAHQSMYTYRCHAGMIENVVPIYFENEIAGYIIFGQMLDGTKGEKENIRALCAPLIQNDEKLSHMIGKLRVRDTSYVHSAARILQLCIQSSLFENMIKIRKDVMWMKIDRYIDENLSSKISIDDIARHVYCSPSTVSHKTRKTTGLSVCELIKRRRLSKAVHLLTTTDDKINEISAMVGIDDYNYFSRVFRSQYGYSPHEYRKSIQK